MKLVKISTMLVAAAALVFGGMSVSAQNIQKVQRRQGAHQNMMANQSTVKKQMKFDSRFEEEPEEGDIYEIGWGSDRVNAYTGMEIPDKKVINVRRHAMPVPGMVTSPYGFRKTFGRMHKGVDLKLRVGDTVRCAFDGKIRITKYEGKGYGYYVVIRHDNGLETVYGHLSKFLVKPNQLVKAGQPIALGGNTGHSTGPHLHFETRFMGLAINPEAIFDFTNKTVHTDTYTFNKNTYQKARHFAPKTDNKVVTAEKKTESENKEATKSEKKKVSGGLASNVVIVDNDANKNLYRIAKANNTTVAELKKLNNLSSDKVEIGQKIRVS